MGKVESIERQIEELSAEELAVFRSWYASFDAQSWDEQFRSDVEAGKFKAIAERALQDHAAGRSTKL